MRGDKSLSAIMNVESWQMIANYFHINMHINKMMFFNIFQRRIIAFSVQNATHFNQSQNIRIRFIAHENEL